MVIDSERERKKDDSSRGSEAGLENAQRDQDEPGRASSNPSTTGPAENLRDKAAKAEDKSESSEEPV
jgi:hypothetical protein